MAINETKVFALTANKDLVKKVCERLNLEEGKVDVMHFKDGEILVEIGESVRGKKVFIIQSTCTPVTERLMELLIAIDAFKRASASEINVIMPYYGYARQDRKAKPRQPITSKLVADLLCTAGAKRVVTINLHAAQIQGFFSCPADDLDAIPMFGKYFKEMIGENKDDYVVVSPDHGGTTRARKLAEMLDVPIAIVDKRRPKPNVCEATSVIGEVKDKNCIVVDDICDTGGSLVASCNILKGFGAKDVYVSIVHPVFSGDAIDKIENSCIKKFITTDTVPLTPEKQARTTKVEVLTTAKLLASVINSIAEHTALSDVYSPYMK